MVGGVLRGCFTVIFFLIGERRRGSILPTAAGIAAKKRGAMERTRWYFTREDDKALSRYNTSLLLDLQHIENDEYGDYRRDADKEDA
jgi:hypothetical protein